MNLCHLKIVYLYKNNFFTPENGELIKANLASLCGICDAKKCGKIFLVTKHVKMYTVFVSFNSTKALATWIQWLKQ